MFGVSDGQVLLISDGGIIITRVIWWQKIDRRQRASSSDNSNIVTLNLSMEKIISMGGIYLTNMLDSELLFIIQILNVLMMRDPSFSMIYLFS